MVIFIKQNPRDGMGFAIGGDVASVKHFFQSSVDRMVKMPAGVSDKVNRPQKLDRAGEQDEEIGRIQQAVLTLR